VLLAPRTGHRHQHACRFADNGLEVIQDIQTKLRKANEPASLYAVHGHYADAGEIAALIAHTLGVPMVLTGHSLGRNKLDSLKRQGTLSADQIEARARCFLLLISGRALCVCAMLRSARG
jgi:hypothetical protein